MKNLLLIKTEKNESEVVKRFYLLLKEKSIKANISLNIAFLDVITSWIGNLKVHERYWNPEYMEGGENAYNPSIFDIYKKFYTFESFLPFQLTQETSRENFLQCQFAFACGFYNGFIGLVQAIPGTGSLILKLIINEDNIWSNISEKLSEIHSNCGKDYPEIYISLPGNAAYQVSGYGKCLWDVIEKYYSTGNVYQKAEKWGGTIFNAVLITFSYVKVGQLTAAINHLDPIYLTFAGALKLAKPLMINGVKAFRCGTKYITFSGESNTFVLRFLENSGEVFTGDWQQAIRWVEVTDNAGNKYKVGLIGDDVPIRNQTNLNNFDVVRKPDGTPISVEG
ncbi:MAG: hypothetical protein HC830_08745, partial [Bacteroidetes bacterium]|nr:hypothetical protein [Bacteroidota bacterium]